MSQDRTYAASIEQDGDRRAKRFCKTTSRRIVRFTKVPIQRVMPINNKNELLVIIFGKL